MCHVDQNCCAEAIIKDRIVYIVDDFHHCISMYYADFEKTYNKYSKLYKSDEYLNIYENQEQDNFVKLRKSELESIYKKYKELK
jgi:hypothetical protein